MRGTVKLCYNPQVWNLGHNIQKDKISLNDLTNKCQFLSNSRFWSSFMTTHHTCILGGMGAATQTFSHCPLPALLHFLSPCYLVSPSPVFLSFCCSPFCVSVSGSCWRGFVCEHWSPDRPTGARSMNTHTVRAALSLHTTFSTGMPEQ